jgi:hypothetical protein
MFTCRSTRIFGEVMKKKFYIFIVLLAILVPKDSLTSNAKLISASSIKQENKKQAYHEQDNQTDFFSLDAEELIEDDINQYERKIITSCKSGISKFSFNTSNYPTNPITRIPPSTFLVFRYLAIHIFIGVFRL